MADKVDAAFATMIKNLKEKTGKTLEQWVKIAKAMGDLKHGQIVKELKEKHGLGHGYANLIAHSTAGFVAGDSSVKEDLVAAQYSGEKAELKPIYDKLIKSISAFGKDVEISPKKTYVSLASLKAVWFDPTDHQSRESMSVLI